MFDIFFIFAQNIDCWYTVYVLNLNKKNRLTPVKTIFTKRGMRGYAFHGHVSVMKTEFTMKIFEYLPIESSTTSIV